MPFSALDAALEDARELDKGGWLEPTELFWLDEMPDDDVFTELALELLTREDEDFLFLAAEAASCRQFL